MTKQSTTKDDVETARRRLEAALRENLRRRKAQQRGRAETEAAGDQESDGGAT